MFHASRCPALLALEDGSVFRGWSFGAEGERDGEVVFNTSMTGYVEILSDPSYRGQMVCMTYPLIGNYGVTEEDLESRTLFLSGFLVKEYSRSASNWRSQLPLEALLRRHGILGIEGIDTRRLVKTIRLAGAMKGVISTEDLHPERLVEKAKASPGMVGRDFVREVTTPRPYRWEEPLRDPISSPLSPTVFNSSDSPSSRLWDVVVLDYGVKYSILRSLVSVGCRVTVLPASTPAEAILEQCPDGVLLTNGPGDPAALPHLIAEIKKLLGKVPLFGICLGHQLLTWALGGRTYKLKFGHHGGNQPVMRLDTRQVEITSQNHNYATDPDSIRGLPLTITHRNLNDGTVEGFSHQELPLFSVQYHPEAAPGPHDSRYLFQRFLEIIETRQPLRIASGM